MPASYPSTAKVFTTKSDGPGNTILAAHINDLQLEVTAMEQDIIAGLPAARGGTGLTAVGSAGKKLQSNGSLLAYVSDLTLETSALTGAQNDFDLDAHWTYLRCTGAAPVFTGFTCVGLTPVSGDVVILECLGTTLKVSNQTGSTAANQIITESAAGQIVGLNGKILCVYDGTTSRWRASVMTPGAWITETFAAGNYTSSSGTWTVAAGDEKVRRFQQRGTALSLILSVETSTVSGGQSFLQMALPGSFTAASTNATSLGAVMASRDAGGIAEISQYLTTAASNVIKFQRTSGTAWSASVDATAVAITAVLDIE